MICIQREEWYYDRKNIAAAIFFSQQNEMIQYDGCVIITGCSWWRHQMRTFSASLVLCERKATGHRWIPLTKVIDAEFWCFLWCEPEQILEQTVEMLVIWDVIASLWRHCNVYFSVCSITENGLTNVQGQVFFFPKSVSSEQNESKTA